MNRTLKIISLVLVLLLIDWTHAFSLHSLSNFDSPSSLLERLRRWSRADDHDEVEIPLNETFLSVNNLEEGTTPASTSFDFETTESTSSMIESIINSTDLPTVQNGSEENTTIVYSALRQDLMELNQSTVSVLENVVEENRTETKEINFTSTVFAELADFNQTVRNESKVNTSQSSTLISQATDHVEWTTTVGINSTISSELNDTFSILTNDEWILHSNITQKDAIIINQEIYTNDTEILPLESNGTTFLASKSLSIPICDHSCQCLKECPYGFEILNDTCLCNPPCQNYQCFGNDTCTVTDNGQPLCQPQNGTTHDRPTRCYQPRDAGYHDTTIRYYNRWYYHPDQDTCHLFVYRGLGGNENNYQTLHECHLECITCAPSPDPGECLGRINMWFFDWQENACREFEYSGCKGNENKFIKKEQCIDTCINRIFNS